jgi:hypothetical protein
MIMASRDHRHDDETRSKVSGLKWREVKVEVQQFNFDSERNKERKMNRKVVDKLTSTLGLLLAVVLLVAGILLNWGGSFATNQVKGQLIEQQITFPAANSAALKALPAADDAAMTKYAGQVMTTGAQAEVFADHFIRVHLHEMGMTYDAASAKSMADPKNAQLAGLVQTIFRGETLRGLLLNAYAFGFLANIANIAAVVCYVGAILFLLLALLGFMHARKEEQAL